jgi:hypothetical protein
MKVAVYTANCGIRRSGWTNEWQTANVCSNYAPTRHARPANRGSIPVGSIRALLGSHKICTGSRSSRVKRSEREADLSPPSSVKTNNVWSSISTSTFLYGVIIKHRGKFTFVKHTHSLKPDGHRNNEHKLARTSQKTVHLYYKYQAVYCEKNTEHINTLCVAM